MTKNLISLSILLVTFSFQVLDAIPPKGKISRTLKEGSKVSLRVKNKPLSQVLSQIEKKTGNKIRCVDSFGQKNQEALSRKVSFNFRKTPFWKVVVAIQKVTGLKYDGIRDGALRLSPGPFSLGYDKPAGDPVVAGAFHVIPEVNTLFKKAHVKIRSEPWIERFQAGDYKATLTLSDGKTIEFQRTLKWKSSTKGEELELAIDPELPEGVRKAKKVELEAKLTIPLKWKEVLTPKIGTLLPETQTFGKVKFRILQPPRKTRANKETGKEVLSVRFGIEGRIGEKIALEKKGGDTLKPLSWSGGTTGKFRVKFDNSKIKGSLEDYQLALEIPTFERRKLGTVRELLGKSMDAGLAKVKVLKAMASGRDFLLDLETSGESFPPETIALVDSKGQTIKPHSRVGAPSREKGRISLRFELQKFKGTVENSRLVLDAPVNIKKATFSLSAQAGKVFQVDDLRIRLLGASKKQQSDEPHLFIEIEVIGGSLPADEIDLVDRAGKAVKYHGWGSTGTERRLITLYYPYAQITGKPGGYRLRLKVPEKVIEHVLKVTLKDVLLSPPQ